MSDEARGAAPASDFWAALLAGVPAEGDPSGTDLARMLRAVYGHLDDLLVSGNMAACDALLARAEVARLPLEVAVGVLLVTVGARDCLPSRAAFFTKVHAAAVARGLLDESPALLEGLA